VTLDPGFRVKPCHPLLYPRSRGQKDGRCTVWLEAPLTAAGRFVCIFFFSLLFVLLRLDFGQGLALRGGTTDGRFSDGPVLEGKLGGWCVTLMKWNGP
jgi:hypothetical protein